MVADSFWRDPKYISLSTEDKHCLLYLSTCSFSNMIGIFKFVPSIMAAEIGWDTNNQLWPVLDRLQAKGYVDIDRKESVIWVKIWWDNNTASQLSSTTLRDVAVEEIRSIPPQWQKSFLMDFLAAQKKADTKNWFIWQNLSPCLSSQLEELKAVGYDYNETPQTRKEKSLRYLDNNTRNEIDKILRLSNLSESDSTTVFEHVKQRHESGTEIRNLIAYTTHLVRLAQNNQLGRTIQRVY